MALKTNIFNKGRNHSDIKYESNSFNEVRNGIVLKAIDLIV
jgi:hypothetical protein